MTTVLSGAGGVDVSERLGCPSALLPQGWQQRRWCIRARRARGGSISGGDSYGALLGGCSDRVPGPVQPRSLAIIR
jgi:hypothetical protein